MIIAKTMLRVFSSPDRDIKGANVLVDNHGVVKLADFGASRQIGDGGTVADGMQTLTGTPYFMAQEVIKQSGHGRKADVWSIGCTVVQMSTGLAPWKTMKFESFMQPVSIWQNTFQIGHRRSGAALHSCGLDSHSC